MLIRLTRGQRNWSAVNHPLFNHKIVVSDEDVVPMVKQFINNGSLRDELIFCNLHLIEHTVGRYLYHWPESRKWKDDMVSVGIQTLIQQIDKAPKLKDPKWFRANTVLHIKSQIEMYLNKAQTSVAASLSTNYRRLRDGKPLASIPEISLEQQYET